MSRPDAGAATALAGEQFIRPVLFVYMDILGDEVRANNSGQNISVTGTLKPDLDGTYLGLTADLGDISPIQVTDGGSQTVTAKLSGIKEFDATTMNVLANQANWKGRKVRIWRLIRDISNVDRGSFQHFYTGYMVDLVYGGSDTEQWIEISIESFMAAFSRPSNRTYLQQTDFDAGDLSPLAMIAAANGNTSPSGQIGGVPHGGGYYGGGSFGARYGDGSGRGSGFGGMNSF